MTLGQVRDVINGKTVLGEKKEIQEENSENSNKESYDYQTTVEKVNNQIGYDDAVELYKMLNSQYSDNAIKNGI